MRTLVTQTGSAEWVWEGDPAARLLDELAAAGPGPDDILQTAVTFLSTVRPGTWVALAMNADPSTSRVYMADEADPRRGAWIDQYMVSLGKRGTVPTVGMSRKVIETGEPMLVPSVDIERYLDFMTTAARAWMAKHPAPPELRTLGTVIVPMRAHGVAIGTLQLTAWNSQPLDADDVEWIQKVADRLGTVVDNARAQEESARRLDRLSALGRIAMAVAASQDLRLTLQLTLENATSRLRVDAADVLLIDEGRSDLYLGAAVGFRSVLAADFRLPLPADLSEASLIGRRFDRQYDARTDPDWTGQFRRRALFVREGFKSYRAVSLVAHGRLMGMLELFQRSNLEVDQEWLAFLEAIAAQAAIAVRMSNLAASVKPTPAGGRAAEQRPDLSELDWRIVNLVVEGATNRDIAAAVHLSENTIKFHIRRLLDRLGAVNRTDLARKVTQSSWL